MEEERARVLLREERQRLERLLASADADHDRVTPADEVAEDLPDGADRRIGEETDEAVARQLNLRMEALQQAEGRLAAGTYGRSVLSGRLIPDERLEAFPLAELTADEEAAREHVERPFAEAVERAADGEDRAGRDPALLDAARLGPSRSRSRSSRTRRCRTTPWSKTTRRPSTSRRPSLTRPCPTASPRTTPAASNLSPSRSSFEQLHHRATFRRGSAPVMVVPRRRPEGSG